MFELPELRLKLELHLQELSLLILANIVLVLQGTESGLQLLILWWEGAGGTVILKKQQAPPQTSPALFPVQSS